MSAPSKGRVIQGVKISPTQSLASGVEQIHRAHEVMSVSMHCKRMQQAVTQVKVLSSVISLITRVDAIHYVGRQHSCARYWRARMDLVGVLVRGMLQNGSRVNLGDPVHALAPKGSEYQQTSRCRQGCWDNGSEVGSAGSTRSAGKPRTWGSGRRGEMGGRVFGIHASQRAK